jgi:hypothetical protein
LTRHAALVSQRIAAAAFGGYALAAACSILLSFTLPAARADAVLTGLLVSFAVYAVAIIWAFAVRSVLRMWIGMSVVTALFGSLAVLLKLTGVP